MLYFNRQFLSLIILISLLKIIQGVEYMNVTKNNQILISDYSKIDSLLTNFKINDIQSQNQIGFGYWFKFSLANPVRIYDIKNYLFSMG